MIVLPSETQSREFDAKLLLACALAEKGLSTIVGSRIAIHNRIHKLSPGIYIAKDFRKPSSRIFRILMGLGAAIIAWDEEGVIFFDRKTYHERRVHAPALAQVKEFIAWGPMTRDLTVSAPGYHGQPVHVLGNPRVDMLRPELRASYDGAVRALRERHGDFILINTNFGKLNHFLPTQAVKPGGTDRSVGGTITPWMNEAWRHRAALFAAFKAMILPLADRFPDRMIVIRPHPSESLAAWREAAEGRSNVTVIHEGPVQPWLLACAAMVHSSCTTGIEGYLLGARVISYRPVQSDTYDHKIANDLSHEVFSLDEVLAAVAQALAGRLLDNDDRRREEVARGLFASLDGPLASDRIAGRLAELAQSEDFLPPANRRNRTAAMLHAQARAAWRLVTAQLPRHKHGRLYSRKRFPGVSLADVRARLEEFAATLSRFEGIRVSQVATNVFRVDPRQ